MPLVATCRPTPLSFYLSLKHVADCLNRPHQFIQFIIHFGFFSRPDIFLTVLLSFLALQFSLFVIIFQYSPICICLLLCLLDKQESVSDQWYTCSTLCLKKIIPPNHQR